MNDEVHTFNWRIDNAEFFNSQRKCTFEELLIQVLDDCLLSFQIIYITNINAHGFVKRFKLSGIFLKATNSFQLLYHFVHRVADCIVVYEVIIRE